MEYFYLTILSLILLFFSNIIARKYDLFDLPNTKKIHKEKVPNLGGVALIIYTLLIVFFYEQSQIIENTLLIFIIVIFVGLIDDIKNINPVLKLLCLFIPIYFFSSHISHISNLGEYNSFNISLGSLGYVFTILCIFLLTNAYNYIDGQDGLLSSLTIITLIFFSYLIVEELHLFLIFIIFLATYSLFNINFLNVFPKQFIGDSGSLGFGFLISSFLIIFTQSEKFLHPSTIIWIVAFVVYEFLSINLIRIKLKKNIFKRDLNFIFNILEKKYSKNYSLIICNLIHLFFCIISLIVNEHSLYLLSIVLFIALFFVYFFLRIRQVFNLKL
tara:strand:+ start:3790 stop:4776 length:987 start_codon:yes stop_codon:yes gene_type:complete